MTTQKSALPELSPRFATASRFLRAVVLMMFWAGLPAACGKRAPAFTPEELTEATVRVRDAFHLQDYEFGAELGEEWAGWAPEAMELKAWTVANLAKAGFGYLAAKMAEEMAVSDPASPWSSFAIAAARTWTQDQGHAEEALASSEKALSGLPGLMDAVTLRIEALSLFQDLQSVLAFASTLSDSQKASPDIRALEAAAMWPQDGSASDSILNQIFAVLEDILEDHPDHLDLNLEAASFLNYFLNDPQAAVAHLERSAELTPSPLVHSRLWNGLFSNASLDEEKRVERVVADVQQIVEGAGESPARWAGLAKYLNSIGMGELGAEVERLVLEEHPGSWAEEMVLGNRFKSLAKRVWEAPPVDGTEDAEESARLIRMLDEFIARPKHHYPGFLLEAHWDRFILLSEDPDPTREALRKSAGHLVDLLETTPGPKPPSYLSHLAMTLAEGGRSIDEARRAVDLGPADSPILSAARGLILLEEGRLDEAEEELSRARDLDPEDFESQGVLPFSYLYSGELMERRAQLATDMGAEGEAGEFLRLADQFYQDGIRLEYYPSPSLGIPWTNPSETAFEELYRKRHGSLDGFEDYLAAIKDEGWEERKEAILAERISDPGAMEAFVLETLDGQEVRSESLLGKVLVINFWGTW